MMKKTTLIQSLALIAIPIFMGSTALAQDSESPKSFDELLKQIQDKQKTATDLPTSLTFDFPMPPAKPSEAEQPWGPDGSIFLKSKADGGAIHTLSKFVCPPRLDKSELKTASLGNATGATVQCDYSIPGQQSFSLVVDGIGGRPVDLDGIISSVIEGSGKKPDIKSKTISLGKSSANCRYDSAVDPRGFDVSMAACHYGAYAIKLLSLGTEPKTVLKTFEKTIKSQTQFAALRERCVSHLEKIKNMQPSGATGRPLLADSAEYKANGPTCFISAQSFPQIKDGLHQIIYTFPDNPDTPLMVTLHRDNGRMVNAFRLQHAHARQPDRDSKPSVYNLIKTEPDGTLTIFDVAYSRVLPLPRFLSEAKKADVGDMAEKLTLARNKDGGFNMVLK